MSLMDLYLVRHGDTQLGPDGLYPDPAHLSESGHAQARALAPRLRSINPDVLITSGMERANETAAPFVESSRVQPLFVPEFDEIGIGNLRSRNLSVLQAKLSQRPRVSDFSEFDGESSTEFAERVLGGFRNQVLDQYNDGLRVALVIHGGPINVILQWVENGNFSGTLSRNIKTASVSLMRRRANGLEIVYESDTSHLDDPD
jgi:broad specificity phosphatase PhoE